MSTCYTPPLGGGQQGQARTELVFHLYYLCLLKEFNYVRYRLNFRRGQHRGNPQTTQISSSATSSSPSRHLTTRRLPEQPTCNPPTSQHSAGGSMEWAGCAGGAIVCFHFFRIVLSLGVSWVGSEDSSGRRTRGVGRQ